MKSNRETTVIASASFALPVRDWRHAFEMCRRQGTTPAELLKSLLLRELDIDRQNIAAHGETARLE